MTATDHISTDHTTTEIATSGVEFAHLDPTVLVIADNVRDAVDLDTTPDFVDSIRTHGVLQPILAVHRSDDTVEVVDGSLSSSVLL